MNTTNKVYIPNDIIREITSNIDPNDVNTLYSCSLINRVWCEHIIPLLWKNPFDTIKNNPRKLISTYFNFLDERTKSITGTQSYKKPLIKYPSYLQRVSFMSIYDAVLDWVSFNDEAEDDVREFPSKEDQVFSITLSKEILKMILSNSPRLEYLKIDISRELKRRTRCESIPFPLNNNYSVMLTRLNTLHCSNDSANNEMLKVLAQSSTSIKNIIISENDDWNNDNIGIVKLIEAQQRIENVIINQVSKGITEILSSLKSQKNTLKRIQFNHVSFFKDECALKCISGFSKNLIGLGFKNCYNFTNNVMKELLNVEFPKLKSLEINNENYLPAEKYPTKEIIELIENLGNHLSELILNTSNLLLSNSIFYYIQKHCNNLTTLGLDVGYNQLLPLLELFKSLNKLERFIVQNDGGLIHIDNWLVPLAKKIPQSITSFEVDGWIISPNGLKDFLNVTKNQINILSWRLPIGAKFDDYSNIIDEYTIKNDLYVVKKVLQNKHQKNQSWDEVRVEFI